MIAQCCLLYSGTAINAVARNECSVKPKKKLGPAPKLIVIVSRSSRTTLMAKNPDRRIQRPQRPQTSYQ